MHSPEDIVIASLFQRATVFLESALFHYGYTDRVPLAWQIAVDLDSEKSLYKLDYPLVQPYFLKPEYFTIGEDKYTVDGIDIRGKRVQIRVIKRAFRYCPAY